MGACLGQYCKLCMKPVGQSETMHSCTAVNSSQGKHSWLQWCREKFFQRGQILVMVEGHHNIFLEAAGQQCHQWSHSGKLRHGTCGFYTTARKFRGIKFSQKLTRLDYIFADSGPIAIINDVNILSQIKIFAGRDKSAKTTKIYPAKLSSYTVYRYFQKSIVCMEI